MTVMNANAKRLVIVGGGAAGLMTAVAAGDEARKRGMPLQIDILERDDRVGRSILVTGNGRCNFSNLNLERELWRYWNADFVREALNSFGTKEADDWPVVDYLNSLGLEWRAEDDGRLYPLANKASVVVDVLRAAASQAGARELCGLGVKAIEPPREEGKRFTLRMADGTFERADAVVLACGGRALRSVQVGGLQSLPQRPILGPLRVTDDYIPYVRELDNIRVRCSVLLFRERDGDLCCIGSEKGELMFRKYGVSGICVFNLSRLAQPGDVLTINFFQTSDRDQCKDYLLARKRDLVERFGSNLTCSDVLRGFVLPRVADVLLKKVGLSETSLCTDEALDELVWVLSDFTLIVAGAGDPDICQVMRGGIAVDQVDPTTMEAHLIKGLHIVGEALDVDGPCGGFNLHWAWASGMLAGRAAAANLLG